MTETPTEKARTASAERLVVFTDAVAAIAITLLILPLMESVSEASSGGESFRYFVHHHAGQFGAFVLSFAVIFRLWWAHHQLFRHITRLDNWVVRWSLIWTFAIVLLPIPTALITAYRPSAGTVALYGGALCLASGSLLMLGWHGHRHPELAGDGTPVRRDQVLASGGAFVAELVATVIGSIFADRVNFWAFLLLFLTAPIQNVIKSRWREDG